MYKLDLNFQSRSRNLALAGLRILVASLAISFFVQAGLMVRDVRVSSEQRTEASALNSMIASLETRKAELERTIGNPAALAGAVKARNDWFLSRNRNPVALLAALERNRPRGTQLRSFESNGSSGNLEIESPDTDTATRWLNASLGNVRGRMTVEDKLPARLVILFSWND